MSEADFDIDGEGQLFECEAGLLDLRAGLADFAGGGASIEDGPVAFHADGEAVEAAVPAGGVGGVGIVRGFSRMKLLLNSIFKGRITAATSRLSFSPTVLVTVTWTFLKRSLRTNWN